MRPQMLCLPLGSIPGASAGRTNERRLRFQPSICRHSVLQFVLAERSHADAWRNAKVGCDMEKHKRGNGVAPLVLFRPIAPGGGSDQDLAVIEPDGVHIDQDICAFHAGDLDIAIAQGKYRIVGPIAAVVGPIPA